MTLRDKELLKFKNDMVKVSIQEDVAADENNPRPVKVVNSTSDAVPVILQNLDAQVDLEVHVDNNITVTEITNPVEIDSTTPIDVDVSIRQNIFEHCFL